LKLKYPNGKKKKIETVGDLLIILEDTIPKKFRLGKIHYATKIFQSLRIEVNSELEKLEQSIFDISQSLNRGGRLAIITFHSLEDRIVKHAFQKMQDPCICPPKIPCICGKKPSAIILSKKPTLPSEEEVDINPRARSAKLRVIEKL
jgi:16S rRNA (cytosine1402-N4)-methyltransferase